MWLDITGIKVNCYLITLIIEHEHYSLEVATTYFTYDTYITFLWIMAKLKQHRAA